MNDAQRVAELKECHDFERGARWAAEESLAWIVSIETGWLVTAHGHSWWLGVAIGIATFFLVARYFGRREERAEDAYNKAAGIGRYAEPPPG